MQSAKKCFALHAHNTLWTSNTPKQPKTTSPKKVAPAAHFEKDLGLDSHDVVELVMAFEEEFAIEIPDTDADKIFSVEDAVNYIARHPMAK